MSMEDLRQTAMAYYRMANDNIKFVVQDFYEAMHPNDNGGVGFMKFSEYMKTLRIENMSSMEFYDELKQPQNNELYLDDIITLFYIIHSQRPFCQGQCKKFVKGIYFTCVECFDVDHGQSGPPFSVCSQCFNGQNFKHQHKEFMDPSVLLIRCRSRVNSQGRTGTELVRQPQVNQVIKLRD